MPLGRRFQMGPYSTDLRQRVVDAYKAGVGSIRRVATLFELSFNTVENWLRLERETGSIVPRPHVGGRTATIQGEVLETLRRLVDAQPDATLAELRAQLEKACAIRTSEAALCRTLKKAGLSRKKKSLHATEQERPDVVQARAAFRHRRTHFDPDHLVVLDEFGINLAMTRLYARAPIGQRAVGSAPARRGLNVTLLFGLRPSGAVAPFLLPGAMDHVALTTYVQKVLGPELGPKDLVLLDNVAFHHADAVEAAVRARGARLVYLPPYSPDFSPIELCGSKVKTELRAAAARSLDALTDAVRDALDAVSPQDAEGYFEHCGFRFKPG